MIWLRHLIARLLAFLRVGRAEAELSREVRAHLQLLEDRFLAEGMSPREARYAARRAFGGVEQVKERQRDARSFRILESSRMDLKLGLRMLLKYPGLTIIGGLGLAVGVAIAAGAFSILYTFIDPALPLADGDRIVTLQQWDASARSVERRVAHDFLSWRSGLNSVEDVGAFRDAPRNLIVNGVQPEVVRVAEMSASGFHVTRVPPLMGRYLLDVDERPGAPDVVVVGFKAWQHRFFADPAIVGRTIQLGDTSYTVVGVMPERYAFPVNHQFWVPLRLDAARFERLRGPSLTVFARLRAGATIDAATRELQALTQRTAAEHPKTYEHIRSRVLPYTYPFFDLDDPSAAWMAHFIQFLITLLLLIVCVNVAILVYARTATRHAEIAVRTALGASRRRIVGQLFVEALVLTSVAAAIGLFFTAIGLRYVNSAMTRVYDAVPFWWEFTLSSGVVIYVVLLTLGCAAVVGILPALKATGRQVQSRLQGLAPGAGSGMHLGRTWTFLIVMQVAIAVALLPAALLNGWGAFKAGTGDPGFAADEFITAGLGLDRGTTAAPANGADDGAFERLYAQRYDELASRLEGDAAVSAVTFSRQVPGEETVVWVDVEGVPTPQEAPEAGYAVRTGTRHGHQVLSGLVAVNLFDAFDVPVLTGRTFARSDTAPTEATVVANRTFVDRVLGGGNAIGRRVRYVGISRDSNGQDVPLGRWYEIVGVVADFPINVETGVVGPKLYHASTPERTYPLRIAVRLRGTTPSAFANRLREIAASVDPNLQLRDIASMDAVLRRGQDIIRIVAAVLASLTLAVIILSAAGIYAMMSFIVSQRRREIGIRAALGADPRRIMLSIFARALWQVTAGAVFGMAVAAAVDVLTEGNMMAGTSALVLPIVAAFMMIVGLLAVAGPARRGMQVQPTEALRAE